MDPGNNSAYLHILQGRYKYRKLSKKSGLNNLAKILAIGKASLGSHLVFGNNLLILNYLRIKTKVTHFLAALAIIFKVNLYDVKCLHAYNYLLALFTKKLINNTLIKDV